MELSFLGGSARRAATPWASVFVTHVVPSGTPEGVAWRGTSWPRACTAKGGMSTRRTLNSIGAQSITKKAVFEDPSTKKAGRRRSLGVSPRRLASDDAGPDLGHGSTTGDRGRSSGRARLRLHRRVSWHHADCLLMPRGSLAARLDRVWMQVARVVDSTTAPMKQPSRSGTR